MIASLDRSGCPACAAGGLDRVAGDVQTIELCPECSDEVRARVVVLAADLPRYGGNGQGGK